MNVALVTSYTDEPRSTIEGCIDAVRRQTVPATHIIVADGAPQEWIDAVPEVRHIRLDRSHPSRPLAPIAIGASIAAGESFDAIGIVDVDTVIAPEYVASCIDTAEREYQLHFVLVEGEAENTTGRAAGDTETISTPDGTPSGVAAPGTTVSPGAAPDTVDRIGSLFVLRRGFPALPGLALIPTPLAFMGLELLVEKFRILEYHGVATEYPLVRRRNTTAVPIGMIREWWSALSEEDRRLVQRHLGGTISFDR